MYGKCGESNTQIADRAVIAVYSHIMALADRLASALKARFDYFKENLRYETY